jgi:hypothetical protein
MPERRKNADAISGRGVSSRLLVATISIDGFSGRRMIGDLSQGRDSFSSNRAFPGWLGDGLIDQSPFISS